MLRNYLTVALRSLVANKRHSLINIGGLALGLAACLLILLYVRDELSFDRWIPKADRIAAVETSFVVPGRETITAAEAPGPIKAALEKEFSSDLERVVRVLDEEEPVRAGERQFLGKIAYVDPGFFDVFDLRMVAGNREAALADNASILLSETTARTYFGDRPVVGETLTIAGERAHTVVGVFADLPENSHLALESIALFDPARYQDRPWITEQWTSLNTRVYVLFRSAGAIRRVAAELPGFVDRNVVFDVPGFTEPPSRLIRFDLMPILDIHLHGDKPGYENLGSFTVVVAFAGLALLILIIACINFVNLATARAMTRAREVALRKVVGATRSQLVLQHLGEAVLTALIALVIAVALVELALPAFNGFLHKQLRLDLIGDPTLLATMLGLIVVVGVIGGLYPAIYLSRFRPAVVLKANKSSAHGSSLLRGGLVVFQFAIAIALMVCTAVIYSQTVYARTLDLRFDHGDRMVLRGLGDLKSAEAMQTLRREVAAVPGVRGASLSSDSPPLKSNANTLLYPTAAYGDDRYLVEILRVDPDFFSVYGVEPVAGRLFSADRASDFEPDDEATGELRQAIVVNQAFVAKLGASRPEEVLGKVLWEVNQGDKPMIASEIIGVVPDLHLRSVRVAVTPLAYKANGPTSRFSALTVHVAPGAMRDTVAKVEAIWARLAPAAPIRASFVDDELTELYDADAQRGQIFAGFAGFAVVIACLGLFGLASFAAERRTKEIGVRKVLGASVLDIVRLLVWQFSRPVLLANLIAWPVSFYVMSRWLDAFRYRIELTDPRLLLGVFGGAALLALAIAWLTTAGQAYRVARANPGKALRVD